MTYKSLGRTDPDVQQLDKTRKDEIVAPGTMPSQYYVTTFEPQQYQIK